MKRYYEAPDQIHINTKDAVFLAGGITGCSDWQQVMAYALLQCCPNLTVLNPRRENFPMDDPSAAEEQIKWEYAAMLRHASIISFWFSNEAIQPISLFELGRWTAPSVGKKILVGSDPGYMRFNDIKIQLSLSRPDIKVVETTGDLIEQIMKVVGCDGV